jgi:hypothetical protein
MFTRGRYLVIDDEPSELDPLVKALHRLGAPCIGWHWTPEQRPGPDQLRGIRILFTDLHLTKGEVPPVTHYDTIIRMLEEGISEAHGPYIVVLWTSHEEQRGAFVDRLNVALDPVKHPLAVLGLDKNAYRDGPEFTKLDDLQRDVTQQLGSNAQLQALLSWEHDVLAAADATLAQVSQLVPAASRTMAAFPAALDGVLSKLSIAALGMTNAPADPRGGVSRALAPLLMDRIANQNEDAGKSALWNAAVSFPAAPAALSADDCARMNRMIHCAIPPAEGVAQTAWGAAIRLGGVDDAVLTRIWGDGAAALKLEAFRLKAEGNNACELVAVRIGAVCDYAQGKPGPVPYVLGALTPVKPAYDGKSSPAEYEAPLLKLTDAGPIEKLTINARFVATLTAPERVDLPEAAFRIREQLLVALVGHVSGYVVRPGFLSFRP